MNNFSNEPKNRNKVRKAVIKTIVKRYSFIVWVPLLIYILYNVGEWVGMLMDGSNYERNFMLNIAVGFYSIVLIFVLIIIIVGLIEPFIKYFRKTSIKKICKDLKECIFFVGRGFIYIIKIPKRILKRIISEPKKFKDLVQKEIDNKE